MYGLFASLKGLVKIRHIYTDGPIFRLHYRWTVLILLAASILLTCRQFFGDPIHCLQRDVKRTRAVETFCWIHATYVLPEAWNKTVGSVVPHPGIDRYTPGQEKKYHGYYQWVSLCLLFQAVLFYLPRYFWKMWENGLLKALILNLDNALLDTSSCNRSYTLLVNCLRSHWGLFRGYARRYIACELLTLINVFGQMFLLDTFLGGHFTSYGLQVIQWGEWDQEYRTDPMIRAFPRMTKCMFHDFGSSGDVQRIDALCLLPLNVLNEKIYIFLWFWMMMLISLTILTLAFRFLLYAMPLVRYCVLLPRCPQVNKGALERLINRANFGDWFILYLLAKNLYPEHFCSVVGRLAVAMEENGCVRRRDEKLTYV